MAARRHLVGVLISLGTALAVEAAEFPQVLGDPRTTTNAQPWASQIREANQLVNSAPEQARAHFELVLAEFPGGDGARQAIQGIADTYVVTRDYDRLTRFLENQMSQSRTPSVAQSAREVYSRVATTVDNAHMQAYQRYSRVQREYDDISWFNIFRIFDKFKLRGEMKDLKQDLDYISEVKMRFNPAHILPATQISGGGFGDDEGKGDDPLPLPGGNGGTGGSTLPGGNDSFDLPDPADLPEPGDLPAPGTNPGGLPPEFEGVRAEGDAGPTDGPNLGLDVSSNNLPDPDPSTAPAEEEGETEVLGSSTSPAAGTDEQALAAEVEEKLKAVQLLKAELQQILALVPEDRRDQAKSLLVGNGGFAVLPTLEAQAASDSKGADDADAKGSETTTPSASPSPSPAADEPGEEDGEIVADTGTTTTPEASDTASDTANSTSSASTTVVAGDPVETTETESAGESTAASTTAATSAPAAPDVAALKTEMELAYQEVLASMRRGSGTSLAATQQKYIQAMEKYRAASIGGQPAGGATTTTTGGESSTAASATAADTDDVSSTAASGTAGAQPVPMGGTPASGLGGIDPQQLNTGGPVKINPGVGSGGAPLSDAGIRNIRSGLH